MENELFYPDISVNIGDYSFSKGIEIEVYSSKESYFDWAKVRFTKPFSSKVSFKKKDLSVIKLGYEWLLEEVFSGYVMNPISDGEFKNEVTLKDDMLLLEETFITNTFIDASPQEIIEFCLRKAGIEKFNISRKAYQRKKIVAISQKNVIQVVEYVHSIWSIQESMYFSNGVFYWGEKPRQEKIYEFEYGVNIIHLAKSNGLWELETVSAPFVKHSNKIILNHPDIEGEFEVKKVVFSTNEIGFIRTFIYF